MKLKVFMTLLAIVAVMGVLVSCGEKVDPVDPEEDDKTETVDPTPKFIKVVADRTLTEENFGDNSDGVVPVEWVKTDKVTLYSPHTKMSRSERFTCKPSAATALQAVMRL